MEATTWAAALTLYVRHRRASGTSEGTIRLHRHYLRHLARYVAEPYAATTPQLEDALSVRRWSPETRKSARAAVRAFYRWAHAAGHVAADPSASLPAVRVPAGAPRPTPEDVLARALALADRRGRLMLLLAARGGLRCSEVAQVHTRDLAGSVLYVHGKGGKTRRVPVVDAELLYAIRAADGWLFPGRTGGHLAPCTVGDLLGELLPDGWTGHTLRHRFASRAYAGTRDLGAVQDLLGHARPETTRRYVVVPDDHLVAAVAAAA
ncbi:hypothetical protein CWIS_09770 [Cellulomonas sp. A375-1]|uniref:tyrosine-type recombinase/integrase n=1 Tax=Cellulomonas sp. A375-1 TaxID=1672219 RepID=UPI0006528113|nr:tyrosine-type recombinase/integrase [Cellulomonas sp. A375-1]KMM45617.1 hypothetical protein CWIS_09770 [Cellulomonas sp. A375-1]